MGNKHEHGFTLIEMLVTVAVFTVLMTIVGSIFIQTLNLQRIAFNLQTIEENSRFSLEAMAREIRFGELTSPSTACPGSNTLSLTHPVNGDIVYSLVGGRVVRNVNGIDAILTSVDVDVTNLSFCVTGAESGDGRQPVITILMSMETGTKNPQHVDLQTTITTRFLDVL